MDGFTPTSVIPSTIALAWMKLKRLVGRPTATADHEGQLRYDRDGDVDGKVYWGRHITGATYDWQEVVGATATQTLTNKTMTAPTLTDFTNAQHDHLDADDGGTLTLAAIPAITASVTEVNYTDGVTSAIQTQLDGKVNDTGDTMTGALTIDVDANPAFNVIQADNDNVFYIRTSTTPPLVSLSNGALFTIYSDNGFSVAQFAVDGTSGNTTINGALTTEGDVDLDNALLINGNGSQLAFFGVSPVTQRPANADTSGAALGTLETEVNQIKQLLRDYGLLAT
jgi:hypothetical protein